MIVRGILLNLVCLLALLANAVGCADDMDARTSDPQPAEPTSPETTTLPPIPPLPPPPPPPPPSADLPFISEWDVPADDLKIVLPLPEGYTYNFKVDWGDSRQTTITSHDDPNATHTYTASNSYIIQISGTMPAWSFKAKPDSKDKLINVIDLGSVGWKSLAGAFYECNELQHVWANDGKVTRGVGSMAEMFAGADIVNPDVSNWNTEAVTDISAMFKNTRVAAPDVSNWDTEIVTNMAELFAAASGVDELAVDTWDTSAVTNMTRMFANTGTNGSMNKFPYIVDWDFSKVKNMDGMLTGQTLESDTYSGLLGKIAEGSSEKDVHFDAGNSTYSKAGANHRHQLIGERGWTIYDGGPSQ